jgi:hypothetical protein
MSFSQSAAATRTERSDPAALARWALVGLVGCPYLARPFWLSCREDREVTTMPMSLAG